MKNPTTQISLGSAALIAGLGLLVMVMTTPFAEFFVFPKLVVPNNPAETVKNIMANVVLFRLAILGYLLTFICDIVVAWALYIFLKPVNEHFSLLAAWFRLIYTVISLVALLNLVNVLRLLTSPNYVTMFDSSQINFQIMLSLRTFRNEWSLAYIFFGIHLLLLGYLVFRANYIPKILGILLIIAGFGWLIDNLQPFLFSDFNVEFGMIVGWGELIFMLWLLFRGSKMKEI